MGLRRMVYRLTKSRRFWILAVILFIFYVNIIQFTAMSRESGKAGRGQPKFKMDYGENDYGIDESDYVQEYEDLLKNINDEDYEEEDGEDDDDDSDNEDDDKQNYNSDEYLQEIAEGDGVKQDGNKNDIKLRVIGGNYDKEIDLQDDKDQLNDVNGEGYEINKIKEYDGNQIVNVNIQDDNEHPVENDIKRDEKIKENDIKGDNLKNVNEGDVENNKENPYINKDSDTNDDMDDRIWIKREELNKGYLNSHKDMTFNGYYKIGETIRDTDTPVTKVLLLTYQRAGSSFAGELLTSGGGDDILYIFEPLYIWRMKLGPGADTTLEENSAKVLGDLLDCKPEVIRHWRRSAFAYFRRRPDHRDFCQVSKVRVIKSIRAHASFVLPWIKKRPDIKVIHMVRDPRGILNSVQRGGRWWSENNRNINLQCNLVEQDLELEQLGPGRYLRVHYEDLVDKPLEETKRMFKFAEMDLGEETVNYLKIHTGLGTEHLRKPGYFNTYRDSNFRHDHWKTKLDNREIEFVENACSSIMRKLGYTPLPEK